MMKLKRVVLKELFRNEGKSFVEKEIVVKGWVRSVRKSKKFCFIVVNDGSCHNDLQVILDSGAENYEVLSSMLAGSAVSFQGVIVPSGGKGQAVEMQAKVGELIGACSADYPLQKKATSLENLREHAHLRARTNLFGSIFRVRNALAQATHRFFSDRGFFYLNSPIITAVDGEGAGEMFKVTTLNLEDLPCDGQGKIDYTKDYFQKEVSLAVTGQLEAECHALGLGAVYTFGPTFRSENSNTPRHLSEFWMIEPELAFADLDDVALLAADYIKYMISEAIEHCGDDLENIFKNPLGQADESHMATLISVRDSEFKKITYTEAIEILAKSSKKFEFPTTWGHELQTEHERYLAEEYFHSPVIVTDYPKGFKAFYMKQNDDGKTVRAMDVLVPGVGEIIGGSQREDHLEKLVARMDADGMDKDAYWWYLDLRKFGSVPHAGFGLGFERAVMYVTGMSNIRDAIAFPRTPRNCDF